MRRSHLVLMLTVLVTLIAAPLLQAATVQRTVVPLGPIQTQPRTAYNAIFAHVGQGGRALWTQESWTNTYDYGENSYPAGTIIAPEGMANTTGYTNDVIQGSTGFVPSFALDGTGIPVAIFRSTLTDPDFGTVSGEVADVRTIFDNYLNGAIRYDVLDEAGLTSNDLSSYRMIVLPAIRRGNETDVINRLGTTALTRLADFVRAGGTVYAQSNGAMLAEAAGLLAPGTVDIYTTLATAPGSSRNNGHLRTLDMISPLSFSWNTETLYLLDDPTYIPNADLQVVAEFDNLIDGVNQPAIISGAVGLGRVVLVAGHPTSPSKPEELPVFFNALFWAIGNPAELYGDAIQTFSDNVDIHLLPAYESGVPVSTTLTFANVWQTTLENVVVTEQIAPGFIVQPESVFPTGATIVSDTNGSTITWNLGNVTAGKEIALGFVALTDGDVMARGSISFAQGRAAFTNNGLRRSVAQRPFELTARMAARLVADRDLEGDRQYGIPAEGLILDVAMPIENKEDTLASQVVFTDVVPLLVPLVDLENQGLPIVTAATSETVWIKNEPFFYTEAGGGYLPADGYRMGDSVKLAAWTGLYGQFNLSTGVTVTIPTVYSDVIKFGPDNSILLPIKVLTWSLNEWPGYYYEEPAVRYGVQSSEILGRKVAFTNDPGILPGDLVAQSTGGSVYTNLGDNPIIPRDRLSGGLVYVPMSPVTPMLSYQDLWTRVHTLTMRAAFYDVFTWAACNCTGGIDVERSAVTNVTFGMRADINGTSTNLLRFPSHLGSAAVDILIKDHSLGIDIPADQMLVDLGIFRGLGISIAPRSGDWTTSWVSDAPGVTVDVQADGGYDRLLIQHTIPASGTASITLQATVTGDTSRLAEGMLKLHDGARYTYRQQAAGPSRYEVSDTHVQGIVGEDPQITVQAGVAPIQVNSFGDNIYLTYALDDPDDPHTLTRNGSGDPFLETYGFGTFAATTYVGGRDDRTVLHSIVDPGGKTRIRVEVVNNGENDLTNVQVTPQPPTGFTVTPTFTSGAIPPPIFPDVPFLNLTTIPVAGRGVYYFDVQVAADAGPRGRVTEIPIAFSADGGSPEFAIPPAPIGIADSSGKVRIAYGPAASLQLSDTLASYVDLQGAALASADQVNALNGATSDDQRAAIFAGLTTPISYTGPVSGAVNYALPGVLDRLYDLQSADSRVFVVAKAHITPPIHGPVTATTGAKVRYSDALGLQWDANSGGITVESSGPKVVVGYDCITLSGLRAAPSTIYDPPACVLNAGDYNAIRMRAMVDNMGDYTAEGVTVTLNLPANAYFVNADHTPVISSEGQIGWLLDDIAAGGYETIGFTITLKVDPNEPAQVAAQRLLTVIEKTDGGFTDARSQQRINGQVGAGFQLSVNTQSRWRILLPTLRREVPPADLAITRFEVTPADPVSGQPALVTVEIENRGESATGQFWVDFYINPAEQPVVGKQWTQMCGVNPCEGDGIAWFVGGMEPGARLTLTSEASSYDSIHTLWTGGFRVAGPLQLYVLVDSWHQSQAYGAVMESDETNNLGSLSITVSGTTIAAPASESRPLLPTRPAIGR